MSDTALLIIDMLNTFDFEEPTRLIEATHEIVAPITLLRDRARKKGMPVIFVNDNYGRWRDETGDLIAWLTRPQSRGAAIAEALQPQREDYFVVKPEASGFYATTLPALLPRLEVSSLILTGIAAEVCVLFTAADAHMREYDLWVPEDAIAGTTVQKKQWAIEIIGGSIKADVRPTSHR